MQSSLSYEHESRDALSTLLYRSSFAGAASIGPYEEDGSRSRREDERRLTDLNDSRTDDDAKRSIADDLAVGVADLTGGSRLAVLAGNSDGLVRVTYGWVRKAASGQSRSVGKPGMNVRQRYSGRRQHGEGARRL